MKKETIGWKTAREIINSSFGKSHKTSWLKMHGFITVQHDNHIRLNNMHWYGKQWKELKPLWDDKTSPRITCPCGRRPTILYAYQCFHCGIYYCKICAKEHFGPDEYKE